MKLAQNIGIIGLGWLGFPLAKYWIQQGFNLSGTTTSSEKMQCLRQQGIDAYEYRIAESEIPEQVLLNIHTLIVCIPPSKVGVSYLEGLEIMAAQIQQYNCGKVLFVSSTGVFSDDGRVVNENSIPTLQSSKEQLLYDAEQIFARIGAVIVRLAGLYGDNRHPGRWFAGKKNIANGEAPVNLISLEECIRLFDRLHHAQVLPSIVHGVATQHPSRMVFYGEQSTVLGLEKPQFIAEKKQWKIVESLYNFL